MLSFVVKAQKVHFFQRISGRHVLLQWHLAVNVVVGGGGVFFFLFFFFCFFFADLFLTNEFPFK